MIIGYVCTNYNNSAFTVEAVRTLLQNRNHEYRIVVVDNNSGAESVAQLRDLASRYPEVQLILNAENSGYFRGLNAGIRFMRERHPHIEYLVVGNNDLEFAPDFADSIEKNLASFSNNPVISPDIVTMDGVHQNPHVIAAISKLRERVYDLYFMNYYLARAIAWLARRTKSFTDRTDESNWRVAQHIYQGHGSCYILGPRFFEHFSELWAPTFLMGEEYFLSKQLSDKGMQTYYEPGIVVNHHCHAAIARIPSKKMWEISKVAHKEYRKYVRVTAD